MGAGELVKSDKLLKKALRYVSDYWIPVNRELLERIQHGLDSGFYDLERELLAQEMQADIGLFFGCIRELREILSERGENFPNDPDLTTAIEEVDLEFVRIAINSLAESPAVHCMSEGDEHQVGRLLEAVLSTTCASSLAQGVGEEPGIAASMAALRQLGYALVAWNYPSVYHEALAYIDAGSIEPLDILISRRLGFSPLMLAAQLAESWGLPTQLRDAALIPAIPLYEEAHIVSSSHSTLAQICRVSEALARAQFGDQYPQSRGEWKIAVQEVERHLGTKGIEELRARCASVCRSLILRSPDVFRPGLLIDEETMTSIKHHTNHANPYLDLCSDEVRHQLLHLYAMMKGGKPSEKALRFLMRKVIPVAHFSGGCVFTADPAACSLSPQLEVGLLELRESRAVSYLNDTISDDPVPIAFLATDGCRPVVSEHNRAGISSISSAFGRSQRLGVLYVELSLDEFKCQHEKHLNHFRALTHALVDCLGL